MAEVNEHKTIEINSLNEHLEYSTNREWSSVKETTSILYYDSKKQDCGKEEEKANGQVLPHFTLLAGVHSGVNWAMELFCKVNGIGQRADDPERETKRESAVGWGVVVRPSVQPQL